MRGTTTAEPELDPISGLPGTLRDLMACATIPALFARTAEAARAAARFDIAVVVHIENDELTTRICSALQHDESDVLRRQLARDPVALPPGSLEANWRRFGVDDDRARPSALGEALSGIEHLTLEPIAPEREVLAMLVGGRSDTPPTPVEQVAATGIAAMAAVALSRIVLNARLAEVTHSVRHLAYFSETLVDEVLHAPVQLPDHDGRTAAFPLPERLTTPSRAAVVQSTLTRREIEIAELLVEGKTDRDIATALVISVNTAKDHVARIRRKLNASNRVEAAAKYLSLVHQRRGH